MRRKRLRRNAKKGYSTSQQDSKRLWERIEGDIEWFGAILRKADEEER